MQYKDLLRGMVLLVAGVATALAAVSAVALNDQRDDLLAAAMMVWWIVAAGFGAYAGRPEAAAEAVRPPLANSKSAMALPVQEGARAFFARVWPILLFALVAGGLGPFLPQVSAIATGFALGVALSWRNREAAVTAVEDRDGVCFYVEPGHAFQPVELVRTPGMRRDALEEGEVPPPRGP
jgi:hypothetical protein